MVHYVDLPNHTRSKTETPAETVETEALDVPQQKAAKLETSIHQRLEEYEISVGWGTFRTG